MAQKYRIYVNEKVIHLTTKRPERIDGYNELDNQHFDLKKIYSHILNDTLHGNFLLLCDDAKAALKKLTNSVTLVEAAGGLVKNTDNNYLFIFRNGKWDLPKGKLEKGEKKEQGAMREVEEECGISIDKLKSKIINTYHMYTMKGEVVLKKTYWYSMKYNGQEKLIPQTEEGITDVRWVKKDVVNKLTGNTYPSIIDVLQKKKLI